jgi:hypothetical protein
MTERRKRRLVSGSLPPLAVLLVLPGNGGGSLRFRSSLLSADSYGHRSVAKPAHGLVPVRDPGRIEVRTMRVHPQPTAGRMAAKAIGLLMAGDAALQVLPGRLGVTEDPEALAVVEWSHEAALPLNAQPHVTIAAERLAVVAAAAIAGPTERFGSVGGQEIHWMELPGTETVVALGAGVLRVAARTIRLAR